MKNKRRFWSYVGWAVVVAGVVEMGGVAIFLPSLIDLATAGGLLVMGGALAIAHAMELCGYCGRTMAKSGVNPDYDNECYSCRSGQAPPHCLQCCPRQGGTDR